MEENWKWHARHIDNHPVGDVNSALPFTRFRKPSNHLLLQRTFSNWNVGRALAENPRDRLAQYRPDEDGNCGGDRLA